MRLYPKISATRKHKKPATNLIAGFLCLRVALDYFGGCAGLVELIGLLAVWDGDALAPTGAGFDLPLAVSFLVAVAAPSPVAGGVVCWLLMLSRFTSQACQPGALLNPRLNWRFLPGLQRLSQDESVVAKAVPSSRARAKREESFMKYCLELVVQSTLISTGRPTQYRARRYFRTSLPPNPPAHARF